MAAMPARDTGLVLEDVSFETEDFLYRTPIKFGGTVLDRATLLNVTVRARAGGGKSVRGFGSMPLGNVWSFPSKVLTYEDTLGAMKALAARIARITAGHREPGHPIEINHALEPEYLRAAEEVSRERALPEPIPKLCTLVVASPFDAAIHDAFGKAHGLNCYRTYGRDFLGHDLSRYLGPEFRGEFLEAHVLPRAKPRMPLYHLSLIHI